MRFVRRHWYDVGLALAVLAVGVDTCSADAITPVLNVDYESGLLDAGGVNDTNAAAPDAAAIVTTARTGNFAVYHKVVLNDPAYVSDGNARSESDTLAPALAAARYQSGVHGAYSVSLMLKDWQDWNGTSTPIDIVWQFKHTNGTPDAFLGVKRNALVFRYGPSGQVNVINDIRPLDNRWIDVQFDILWSNTNTGWFIGKVSTDGTNYTQFADVENLATFLGAPGEFGYLKWGLYRPDSTTANGDSLTREVLHDNITASVISVPEPSVYGMLASAALPGIMRRRRVTKGT